MWVHLWKGKQLTTTIVIVVIHDATYPSQATTGQHTAHILQKPAVTSVLLVTASI